MNDLHSGNSAQLVPVGPRSLILTNHFDSRIVSEMVNASLALLSSDTISKPTLRIVLGINENATRDLQTLLIKDRFATRYVVQISEIRYAEELLSAAEQQSYDIAIIFVGNLMCTASKMGKRIETVLEAISEAVGINKKPLIALAACASHAIGAVAAGVNNCVIVPFEVADYQETLESCVSSRHKGNERR